MNKETGFGIFVFSVHYDVAYVSEKSDLERRLTNSQECDEDLG